MDLTFARKFSHAVADGAPFALVTLVETSGSAPQAPGANMLVRPDGTIEGTVGGGAVEFRLIKEAVAALAEGRPRFLRFDLRKDVGMMCGGGMAVFIQPVLHRERAVLFGGGHVSRAVAPVLVNLGFAVTVVDDRAEWADSAAFPDEVEVVCEAFGSYCNGLTVDDALYVLVMSRSHAFDYELLKTFVDREQAYLGIMASKNKAAEMKGRLLKAGVAQERLDAVYMPVGMPIGSQTPEEIAISIAAQLVQVRKHKTRER